MLSKNNKAAGISIVLGGGAMRGVSHLGLLDYLEVEHVNAIDYTGVSIGSLVAALYTNGYCTSEIRQVFARELTNPGLAALFSALVPPLFAPLARLAGGVIDLLPLISELVQNYNLKTRSNLRMVAYDYRTMSPVVFENHNYDLATALAASCAVPGIMRPLTYERDGRKYLLVDGGVYHPHPGVFCQGPCIVAKLMDSFVLNLVYPDREQDFVTSIGDPRCGFFTRLSPRRAKELHLFGYERARADLHGAIERGEIPVAV